MAYERLLRVLSDEELEHAGVMRLTRKDVASLLGMGPSAFHREGSSASSDGERLEASGADGAEKMDVTVNR